MRRRMSSNRELLVRERARILHTERAAGGRRDISARRRFNALLRGGASPPHWTMTVSPSEGDEWVIHSANRDEFVRLVSEKRVVTGKDIFVVRGVRADGSRGRRMLLKRIDDMAEAEIQHAAAAQLQLQVAATQQQHRGGVAKMLPIVATAVEMVDGKEMAMFALMEWIELCGGDVAAELCQMTLTKILKKHQAGKLDLKGYAFFEILLRVCRALEMLNRGGSSFVHGDLHGENVLVVLQRRQGKRIISVDDIAHVVLIDNGMSYFLGARPIQTDVSKRFVTDCGGDPARPPQQSRDLLTLFLALTRLIPGSFESVHRELLYPLWRYLNQLSEKGVFVRLNSNTCALPKATDAGNKPWAYNDFRYIMPAASRNQYAQTFDSDGSSMSEPHYIIYADIISFPEHASSNPFARSANMIQTLTRMNMELRTEQKRKAIDRGGPVWPP